MGAWVGAPADYYAMMDHPGESESEADDESGSVDTEGADRCRLRPEQVGDNKVKTGLNTEPTG
jgi:hypothetical protein